MKYLMTAMLVLVAAPGLAFADQVRLPEEDLGEMAAGRQRLEMALTAASLTRHPEMTARAEAGFECWTAGIEAGGSDGYVHCRDQFLMTIAALERLQEEEGGGLMAAQ